MRINKGVAGALVALALTGAACNSSPNPGTSGSTPSPGESSMMHESPSPTGAAMTHESPTGPAMAHESPTPKK